MTNRNARRFAVKNRTLAIAGLAIVFSACSAYAAGSWDIVRGNGTVRLESREVAAFTGIEVAGSGLVRFTVGAERQVTVETDANILPYIRTEVHGGTLVLSVEPGISISTTRLVFRITAPDLRSIDIAGSGDVRLESPIEADRFAVSIAGSGDVEGDVAVDALSVEIRGSGSVTLAGAAASGRFEIYGSGDIEAGDLSVEDARAVIRGSGSVTLSASRSLDVDIAGSGDVRFHGDAKVTVRDVGSGDLVEY
jgi:cytoskeletal protein CcmA (bactofilin family)